MKSHTLSVQLFLVSTLFALTVSSGVAHAELYFLSPQVNGCSGEGLREYAAIISGSGYSGDWVDACRNTPLRVNNVDYPSRDCGWNGGRVWGEFDVADSTCSSNLRFEEPKQDHCIGDGVRQWSAIITGDNYAGDWVVACQNTRASIGGTNYQSHDCAWNGGRVWGLFDVPDSSCSTRLYFDVAQRGECLPSGVREFSAVITGDNYQGDWVTACQQTRANIGDATYIARDCAWNGTRVWGKFDVPDSSCHMRVRGRVRYQDYAPGGTNGNFSPLGVRDVRRSRVELWYGGNAARAARIVETGEDGTFDTFVPEEDLNSYRAIVVATNPAGQVNLRDNTATWFWTPEHTLELHPDGDGLILGSNSGLVLQDPYGDAMSFNALDALLIARDYAIAHGVPAARLNPVSIVPTSTDFIPHTTPSGAWSLIWLPDQNDMGSYMFDDGTVLHEYAHHIQRMNDTYALWPSFHNGCWVGAGELERPSGSPCGFTPFAQPGSIRNSDEFAWFEGFPNYFEIVAGAWGNAFVNSVDTWPTYYPDAAINRSNECVCTAAETYGAGAVEGYVASLLLDLVRSGDVAASSSEREQHLMRLFFNDMHLIRTPGNGMPRIGDFRLLWNNAFPASSFLDDLMISYAMEQSMFPAPVTGGF